MSSKQGGSAFRVARCGAARLASASVATFPAAQEKTRTHTHRDRTSAHKTSTARSTCGAQRAHSRQCFFFFSRMFGISEALGTAAMTKDLGVKPST